MIDALAWVHAETRRRVLVARTLRGGLTSDVRALTLDGGETLVLKCYESSTRADLINREAEVLRSLARVDLPAPRLVAVNATGERPMLLMTRLPGRIWLTPRDPRAWVHDLVDTLARIHAVPIPTHTPDPVRDVVDWMEVPAWTTRHGLWERVVDVLGTPPAAYDATFTHGDFQHFNVMWSRRRPSGVLDWCGAGPGHPDADAAHCRLNLAILFSIEVAEEFREAYEDRNGRALDPWWDLRGLTAYGDDWKHFIPLQVAGRAPVDTAGMDDRVEGLMERAVRRL